MTEFLDIYVRAFAVGLPIGAVAILMLGALRAGLRGPEIAIAVTLAASFFGLWYAIAVPSALAGLFHVPPTLQEPPIVLGVLLAGAGGIWALAWLTPLGRRITDATPLAAIAALQIPRLMGGVFLIGWLAGLIPAAFAVPAGLGDIWAGVAGYKASRALAARAPDARRLLVRANIIGIGDFVVAVSLGIMTSEGFAHVLSVDAPNIVNDYPLALFPAFFVPIFLGFHLIAISRLRAGNQPSQEGRGMQTPA